jgi:cytochrome P450
VRRLTTVAFTPRRVAVMEPFVRELTGRFLKERLSSGRADLIRDLAWDLPALVIFRVLGVPDEDVPRVKAGAENRLLLMWGRPTEDEQVRLARGMAAFWRYAETLVASRAEQPPPGTRRRPAGAESPGGDHDSVRPALRRPRNHDRLDWERPASAADGTARMGGDMR